MRVGPVLPRTGTTPPKSAAASWVPRGAAPDGVPAPLLPGLSTGRLVPRGGKQPGHCGGRTIAGKSGWLCSPAFHVAHELTRCSGSLVPLICWDRKRRRSARLTQAIAVALVGVSARVATITGKRSDASSALSSPPPHPGFRTDAFEGVSWMAAARTGRSRRTGRMSPAAMPERPRHEHGGTDRLASGAGVVGSVPESLQGLRRNATPGSAA